MLLLTILCWMQADLTYAEKASKSGVRPQIISLPDGPGAIEGLGESFEPHLNTGSVNYAISLLVPQGRAGFAPNVRLSYDSGNGNGVVGIGWRLPIMQVRRQSDKGLPRYNDPHRSHPDTYITEIGEELIRVEGDETSNIQVFRLKNEKDFRRYEYLLNEDRWICIDRSGRRHSLGARMDNSNVSARIQRPNDNMTYAWYLGEALDTNGNRILYNYFQDQRQVYCQSIEYGAGQNNSTSAHHRIDFEYESRPDPIVDYRPTFRLVTANRLKNVHIRSSGKLVRRYCLEYLKDRFVSLLSRLTLVGNDEISNLPPAGFEYADSAPSESGELLPITGLETAAILFTDQNPDNCPECCELLDFNGDSLPDLYQSRHDGSDPYEFDILYENQGNAVFARKALSQSDSLGLKIQSENSFVQDINGDGLVDLVAQKGSNPEDFVFRLNTGARWAPGDTPFTFPIGQTAETVFKAPDIRAVDLNSDKQIDTIRSYTTVGPSGLGVVFAAYLNNADGTFDYTAQTTPNSVQGIPTTFSNAGGALVFADMNGDRMQDLVLIRDATNGGPKYWPSMGFGKFDDATSGYLLPLTDGPDFDGDSSRIGSLEVADLNGDGLADLYWVFGSQIRYWLNEGAMQFGPERRVDFAKNFDPSVATYRLVDMDGDGLQDIVFYVRNQPTPDYISKGFWYVRLFRHKADQLDDGIDNDEDGLTDEADEGNSSSNLLTTITNGIGRTVSLLYGSHVDGMLHDRQSGKAWTSAIPFPVRVLRRMDVYDGLNMTDQKDFSYHEGYYDGPEKEFRGFEAVEEREMGDVSAPELILAYKFNTGSEQEALKGKPLALEAQTADGEVFYRDIYSWETRILAEGTDTESRRVDFAYQSSKLHDVIEKGNGAPVQLKWEYEYDNFGNMTRQVEHGRMDPGWDDERVTVTSYTAGYPSGLSRWILDEVVESRTTDENGVLAAHKRNYYDKNRTLGEIDKGNLTRVEEWVEEEEYVISVRNDYDEYGNITAIYDPLYGSEPGHYGEISYDETYHTFPIRECIHTGALMLSMSATYDPGWGVIKTSSDFNGFTTHYGYDTFGRLTSITKPPDTDHTVEYAYVLAHELDGGRTINWVETRQRDGGSGDGFLKSRSFYDGLGRKIMIRAEGEKDAQVVVTDTVQFNARRQPWKKYLPYFETGTLDFVEPTFNSGFTEHFYDARGREIRVNQPVGPEGVVYSTKAYAPLEKTIRDENQTNPASEYFGCAMRYVEDGLLDKVEKGRLREAYEIVKLSDTGETLSAPVEWKTAYSYNLLDKLTGYTDSQNNQKIFEYDGLGRKTFMNDPDRGHMYYTHDAGGNLVRTVDAKNQVIEYSYDGVNRLSAEFYGEGKTEPDVAYHYDLPFGPVEKGDLWQSNPARLIADFILKNEGSVPAEYDLNNDGKVDVADVVKAKHDTEQTDFENAENTLGFLAWVKDQSGEEHNSYDERGRVKWVVKRIIDTGPGDLRNFYTEMDYDSMDRVTKLTYPDRTYVEYEYNSRGLLESVPNVIDHCDYNPAGQNAALKLACGTTTTYEYDHRLRLNRLHTERAGDTLTLQDLNYNFDGVSNITRIEDGRSHSDFDLIGGELGIASPEARKFRATQSFAYDSLYRLTQALNPSVYGSILYRYDRIGNMKAKDAQLIDPDPLMNLGEMTSGGSKGTWNRIGRNPGEAPGPHALTSTEKGPEGAMTFGYDDNGNMTSHRGMTHTWDYRDRLIELTNDSKTAQYMYDYTGTRKKKVITNSANSSINEVFYIDKHSEIREGRLIKYVYEGNHRVARSDETSFQPSELQPSAFYLHDHLGSTNLALSVYGAITEQLVNYPFGHPRKEISRLSQPSASDYKFTGKEQDDESDLQYFETRYLLGHIGQFASVDPFYSEVDQIEEEKFQRFLINPQEMNLYTYVRNSPTNLVDPFGLLSENNNIVRFVANNQSGISQTVSEIGDRILTGSTFLPPGAIMGGALLGAGLTVSGNVLGAMHPEDYQHGVTATAKMLNFKQGFVKQFVTELSKSLGKKMLSVKSTLAPNESKAGNGRRLTLAEERQTLAEKHIENMKDFSKMEQSQMAPEFEKRIAAQREDNKSQ